MSFFRSTMILAALIMLPLGCTTHANTKATPRAATTSTTTGTTTRTTTSKKRDNLYVVPQHRAAGFYAENAESFFTPDVTIISALEGALPMFLGSSQDPRAQTITPKLDGYKRQYVGVVIKGQKMIFGNFFCNAELSVEKPQFVDDGGNCFFNLLFDISSRTFPELQINGDA